MKIDKDIPLPELPVQGMNLKEEFINRIAPVMEIGDSVYIEGRRVVTVKTWITAGKNREVIKEEFQFFHVEEINGCRIWRIA